MSNKEKTATKFFQSEVDDYKKEFYESGYRTFMSVRLQKFLAAIDKLGLQGNAKCLDAGCGPGYLTRSLYDRGFITSALDASPEMLRLTKSLFNNEVSDDRRSEFIEGDIESLPFNDDDFDLVASAGVIEYLSGDAKVMAEFNRVLKPGGYLVLSSTNKYSPIGIFEPIIEALKRNSLARNTFNWILGKLGGTPVRPREFIVRKHTAEMFRTNAEAAGFDVISLNYFYALPWPHPFDRVFPKLSNYLGGRLESLGGTMIGRTFEGLYIVARKKSNS